MNIIEKKQVVLDAIELLVSDNKDKRVVAHALEQIQTVIETKLDVLWAEMKIDQR
jgi:hypothetical protein